MMPRTAQASATRAFRRRLQVQAGRPARVSRSRFIATFLQSLSEIAVSTIIPAGFPGDRGTSLRCARRKT